MSCPYCLAFSRDAANKANPKRKTLVQAYWEYEEDGNWVSFSPAVGGLLETSYESWIRDPQLKKAPEVQSGRFLYRVDFTYMRPDNPKHLKPNLQKMRRVGVTSGDAEYCSMDKKLYEEFRLEREGLNSKLEQLEKERSEEAEQHRQKLAEMEAELQRLRETCSGQLAELGQLRRDLDEERASSARLQRHLAGIFPGRFVALAPDPAESLGLPPGVLPGDVGRVRAMEGLVAAVDFPGRRGLWVPQASLRLLPETQSLACPGSRVEWLESGFGAEGGEEEQRGVVCDSLDALSVHVLCSDGRKRRRDVRALAPATHPRSPDAPLEVGDVVRADGEAGARLLESQGVPADSVGMVVHSEGGCLSVRFALAEGEDEAGVELALGPGEGGVRRDEVADRVRPGFAVRFREGYPAPPGAPAGEHSAIGVVYATHGDGSAIVDFLGSFGLRCNAACLETVDSPSTTEHAVLRLLSDCLSWSEVSAQHAEEREEASLLRLISLLPTALAPPSSSDSCAFSAEELNCHSELWPFLVRTLEGPPVADAALRGEPPLLCVERIEGLRCPALEKLYELGLRPFHAASAAGTLCSEVAGITALRVQGAAGCNEHFLWYAASPESADELCRRGFTRVPEAEATSCGPSASASSPHFAETAPAAELRAAAEGRAGAPRGLRCLLLVRVLLGECLAAAGAGEAEAGAWPARPGGGRYDSRCELREGEEGEEARLYVVQRPSQALPLFRVFCRHDYACRCLLCAGAGSGGG